MPYPRFINFLKDKVLAIRDDPFSLEEAHSLRDCLMDGDNHVYIDKEVCKLLIDNAKMDDEKISIVLDAIKD